MSKASFLLFISLLNILPVFAQPGIDSLVNSLLSKPDYQHASFGIDLVDVSTGENVYELNSFQALIPASTLKLVSSATAIEVLGSNYQFETRICTTGEVDESGTLQGDLVLVGGGDPVLGSDYFQDHYHGFLKNWVEQIKASGIRHINGGLILDGSIYDTEKIPGTWVWEDIGNYYGVGANAFTVYDNLFKITFRSPKKAGKLTSISHFSPEIEGMEITNEVVSANNNRDNAYVYGGPLDKKRTIRGTIPRNRKAFTIKAAIHQPEEVLADGLLKALKDEAISLSGKIEMGTTNKKELNTVVLQKSPYLSEIAEVLNHESVNLFAEHLLKQISVHEAGTGSRQNAIEILKLFWERKGIATNKLFMEDGSGLSHFNAASPRFFTQLLCYMATNEAFVNTLPIAGEGTLDRFNTDWFPNNTLKAKSGSMTRVRCYAGYLICNSGKVLAFSFMCNHFSGTHSALRREIEKLLAGIKEVN